ncbi:MAG: hypothetical protein NTW86_22050 [Candidatus Sumerlaeota bacterium]|nr:hypothetical protein [Candidatus Sumerlaeota bacterium]
MITRTLSLDELRTRSLEEIVNSVAAQHQGINVVLPNGEEVVIQPKLRLRPLPVLEGSVSSGWKDAIYRES